jgi:M6 family metalloprotease-like protein
VVWYIQRMTAMVEIQDRTEVRIRPVVVTALGLWAAVLAYSALAYGGAPLLTATKPGFTCPSAPARGGVERSPDASVQVPLRIDGAAREVWRTQRAWHRNGSTANLQALRKSLSERKERLVQAMRVDPDAALTALLDPSDQTELSAVGANCIETETQIEGTLLVLHQDTFGASNIQTEYSLTTASGEKLSVYPGNASGQDLRSGAKLRIRGMRIGSEVLFDASTPIAALGGTKKTGMDTLAAAATTAVVGPQPTIVILANFNNTPQPVLTPTAASDLINNQINAYYQENSYGKVSFTGNAVGWYTMPIAQTCDYNAVQTRAIAAADPSVDFRQYTHIVILAPFAGIVGCGWTGLSYVGPVPVTTADGVVTTSVAWVTSSSTTTFSVGHELAHGLGMHHAQFLPCDPPVAQVGGTCGAEEYGDPYDILGQGLAHLNARHKELLGFFDPGMVRVADLASTDYTLAPYETAGAATKVIKLVRGKTSGGLDDILFVEYRQPLGYDTGFDVGQITNIYDGALLHVNGTDSIHTGLFDATPPPLSHTPSLPVGATFTDGLSGTRVHTVSKTPDALTVNITPGRTEYTPPTATLTAPAANATFSGTITASATASDASGIQKVDFITNRAYALAIPPFTTDTTSPYQVLFNTQLVPNGFNYVWAIAYDRAGEPFGNPGNSTTATPIVRVTVANTDTVPPTVAITAPVEGGPDVFSPVVTSASASDDVGVWKVEFYFDGSATPIIDTSAPFQTSSYFDLGSHTVSAQAVDFVGNRTTSDTVTFNVEADTISPTASIITPSDGAVVSGIVPITVDAHDNSGQIEYVEIFIVPIVGTTIFGNGPYTYAWDTSTWSEGPHRIGTSVFDPSYNFIQIFKNVIVDHTRPTVSLTAPTAGSELTAPITLSADAADANGIERVDFYRDGFQLLGSDPSAPFSVEWDPQTTPGGSHTLTARAVDAGLNTADSDPISVTVRDVTAPSISLSSPTNGALLHGSVSLAPLASDASGIQRVEYFLDDAPVPFSTSTTNPFSVIWDTALIPDGEHALTLQAVDVADNRGTSAATTVSVDNSIPAVSITVPTDGYVHGAIEVTATVTDNAPIGRVDFFKDGDSLAFAFATSSPFTVPLDTAGLLDGTHTLVAKAADPTGNLGTSSPVSLTVDNTVPTVSLTSPSSGATLTGTVTLQASAFDATALAHVDFLLDGTFVLGTDADSPYRYTWNTVGFSNGSHTLSARAVDAAGNTTTSTAIPVTVSNTSSTGGGAGCFTFGTLVDTPDGPRPIGQIRAGDSVYSYDPTTHRTMVSRVTKTYVHPNESFGHVVFSDGTSLQVTAVHRFYNPQTKDWQEIGAMQPGDTVLRGLGSSAHTVRIRSMEFTSGHGPVYNLEVDRYHTYYVNGTLVHNAKIKQ